MLFSGVLYQGYISVWIWLHSNNANIFLKAMLQNNLYWLHLAMFCWNSLKIYRNEWSCITRLIFNLFDLGKYLLQLLKQGGTKEILHAHNRQTLQRIAWLLISKHLQTSWRWWVVCIYLQTNDTDRLIGWIGEPLFSSYHCYHSTYQLCTKCDLILPYIIVHVHNRDLITIHCYEINRTSWKWKILTNREANNQSKSIEVHILPFQATSVETFVLAFTIYVHVANQHIVYYFHEQIYNQADTQCEKDPITLRYHA